MIKIKVSERTPESFRKSIIRFILKYGDGHITKKTINWLRQVSFSSIRKENGSIIHVLLNDKKNIIGLIAIERYGLEQAIIVIHPQVRKKGLADKLVLTALEDIDRFYVKVANDNIPSLKLCFRVGMRAFDLMKGPTGKPTLILGIGNWNAKEWSNYNN